MAILQTWVCPACGTSFHWARVIVRDGVIARIEPIELDAAISTAHYIVDDAKWIAAELVGKTSPVQLTDDEAVEILRTRLG